MEAPSFDTAYLQQRVARWAEGDRDAADEIIRAAAARLERLARKMLRSFPAARALADTVEVAQLGSIRLLSALRDVRPASTRDFFGLASLQMRRELLDLAARASARRAAGLHQAPEPAGPTDDSLELWCGFHEAVEKLPAEEREVVGLVFYHGWAQAQVAEVMGVSDRQVRRLWASAGVRLRELLGGRFPAEEV